MENSATNKQETLLLKGTIQYLIIGLLCVMFGLIDGYRSHITSFRDGAFGVDLGVAVHWDIVGWLIWVVFIPIVIYLSGKYPINARNWHQRFFLFLPLGLFLSLVRTLFPFLVQSALELSLAPLEWLPNRYFYLFTDYLIGFVFYSVVLTCGQAINYYKRYREEEFRVLELESQLTKSQIQALKMQLQPHFLFNALNSISSLQQEDFETAQEMTIRLGDFLRMTLENVGAQEVTLNEELRFLRCYLDIEKVRFENGLTTTFAIDPAVRFCQVPNMILQPIVENAVKHGIAKQSISGKINITAARENGWLKVEVLDNGHGVDDNDLPNILTKGIGMKNTNERLQKLYASDFRFQVRNSLEPGFGGTSVTICLPYKQSPHG